MTKSVLSLLAVVALSSVTGCASRALPAVSSADVVEPPGSVTVEFEDRERASVPLDIPATRSPRNRRFTCRYVVPQLGESFDTRSQAMTAGARASLTYFEVNERCSSDWSLAMLDR